MGTLRAAEAPAVSFAIDVNILLYASDSGSRFHQGANRFLMASASGPEVFCLTWTTVTSYLRIATHPSIFSNPLSPDMAMENIGGLLSMPHARVLSEQEGFWEIYRRVCSEVPVRGNLVPDAHLASLLLQHGVKTLFTLDRDFRKFDFLDLRDPLGV